MRRGGAIPLKILLLTDIHGNLPALEAVDVYKRQHLDWRGSALARLACDQVFGEKAFMNEIIWAYETGGRAQRHFSRKHDTILMLSLIHIYGKGDRGTLLMGDGSRGELVAAWAGPVSYTHLTRSSRPPRARMPTAQDAAGASAARGTSTNRQPGASKGAAGGREDVYKRQVNALLVVAARARIGPTQHFLKIRDHLLHVHGIPPFSLRAASA